VIFANVPRRLMGDQRYREPFRGCLAGFVNGIGGEPYAVVEHPTGKFVMVEMHLLNCDPKIDTVSGQSAFYASNTDAVSLFPEKYGAQCHGQPGHEVNHPDRL